MTGLLFLTRQTTKIVTGTLAELEKAHHQAMVHNLLFGWLGFPAGWIWTPMALWRNSKHLKQVRTLVAAAAATTSAAPTA
ncbi:MAG: hypothetical protein ACYDB7_05345 [Mycobacteriales bacterium]